MCGWEREPTEVVEPNAFPEFFFPASSDLRRLVVLKARSANYFGPIILPLRDEAALSYNDNRLSGRVV